MIRVVLDVNVLASALVSPTGPPATVLDAWRHERYMLVLSDTMLDRLADILSKPYFRARRSLEERRGDVAALRALAEVVVPAPDVRGVAEDVVDDLVLATAVAGRASHLITGDRGLLECNGYRGLTLLTPAAFRVILESPETAGNS